VVVVLRTIRAIYVTVFSVHKYSAHPLTTSLLVTYHWSTLNSSSVKVKECGFKVVSNRLIERVDGEEANIEHVERRAHLR
jgi:hypothetical protein